MAEKKETKAVAKKEETKKVYLPSGGSIDVPVNATEDELRDICVEIDPLVPDSHLVHNEDGSLSFVKEMGTKG